MMSFKNIWITGLTYSRCLINVEVKLKKKSLSEVCIYLILLLNQSEEFPFLFFKAVFLHLTNYVEKQDLSLTSS